ncbi:hypothetical protein LCGC14_2117250, partial [marine sediment metagenome]
MAEVTEELFDTAGDIDPTDEEAVQEAFAPFFDADADPEFATAVGSVNEFALTECGIVTKRLDRLRYINLLNEYLLEVSSAGDNAVLIIDEAQNVVEEPPSFPIFCDIFDPPEIPAEIDNRRLEQIAPDSDWRIWLLHPGRRWGKGYAAARWIVDRVRSG